jgi:cholesterol transport system auxiliary component
MIRRKALAVVPAVLALSACFGGGPKVDHLLTLTPAESRPAATPVTAGEGTAITVADPTVPQALRTNRVPVYVDDTTIQYLTGAAWVEYPGPLFARLLGETIAVRTGRVVLDSAQFSHDPGTRITGHLARFGLDPGAMEAVVVYDATLTRPGGGVATNRFEARVSVSEATAEAVAPALNDAANEVAGQVAAWVGQ